MAVATKNRRARSTRGSKPKVEQSSTVVRPLGAGHYQDAHSSYIASVWRSLEGVIEQAGANAYQSEELTKKLEAIQFAIGELSLWAEELRLEDFPVVVEFFRAIGQVPVDVERRARAFAEDDLPQPDSSYWPDKDVEAFAVVALHMGEYRLLQSGVDQDTAEFSASEFNIAAEGKSLIRAAVFGVVDLPKLGLQVEALA